MAEPAKSKGKVETVVTYVEMKAPPPMTKIVPNENGAFTIERVERPEIDFYRHLYDAVGRDYNWTGRKLLSDEELSRDIHDPAVEVCVLRVNGEVAGFVELDSRKPPDGEITMGGIVPAHHGKKRGPYLLNWAIEYAWREKRPRRLWLHTCTLDHPKALSIYLKGGFVKYDEKRELVDLI